MLGALALSLVTYARSLPGELVFDDIPLLVDSDCHRLDQIPAMLHYRRGSICSVRPVRSASLALDHALWGGRTWGYHLTNIALHGLVAWLGLLLLLRLTGDAALALAAAIVFSIHPVNTEAVAYVSGRRDLLMALLSLMVTLGYLRFVEGGGRWLLPLILLGLAAAVLAHEAAAALPAALIAIELARGAATAPGAGVPALKAAVRRLLLPRPLLALGLLFALALALVAWIVASPDGFARQALWGPSLGAHVGTVLRVHAHYLRQLVWPLELIADYSPEAFALSASLFEPRALGAAALVSGLCLAAIAALLGRRRALVGGAVLAYFALLLPASQIVIHHELLAEHRLYLPSLCWSALVAAGLCWLYRRVRRRLLVGLLAGVYGASLLVLTHARVLDWIDPLTLWRTTVAQVPRCARARANLGALLARDKRFGPAREHLELALAIRPGLCAAHLNLGKLEIESGQGEKGLRHLDQAVRCKPSSIGYRHEQARALLALGRHRRAADAFGSLLGRDPSDAELHYGRAVALQRLGDASAALRHYRRALASRPKWPRARYRAGLLLAARCKAAEARAMLEPLIAEWPADRPESRRARVALGSLAGCPGR